MHRPSAPPTTGWYVVGDLAIDLRGRCVRRPDHAIELTPRNFDLLCLLLHEPGRVHSRESLFERVWGTTCLEDGNLSQAVSVLRKALGESRKDWIRTVAKRGYSFTPPGEVVWQATSPEAAAEMPADAPPETPTPESRTSAAGIAPDPHATAARAPSPDPSLVHALARPAPPARAPVRMRLAMAALASFALAIPGAQVRPTSPVRPARAEAAQTRGIGIVVIATARPGARAETRDATRLLGEWLRWKLGWLPAVSLVDDAQSIADPHLPVFVLDVAVVEAPGSRNRYLADIALRPAIADADATRVAFRDTLVLDGGATGLIDDVDTASRHALARLFPRRRAEHWPALSLDMAHASTFLDALDAERAHDPQRAETLFADVAGAHPDFAPALWRLATRRSATHHDREALALAQRVTRLSASMPADARHLLAASADTLSSSRADAAADAFAALHRANPSRIDFVLAQAEALQRALRPEAAMRLLGGAQWDRQPLEIRIRQRLARADTAFALGNFDIARESAGDAIALIAQADGGWRRELGMAQLILARAWHQQFRNQPMDDGQFLAAERTFRDAGLALDADLAAFHHAYTAGDNAKTDQAFPRMLASANANGDTRLALQLMRMMSQRYDGDDRAADAAALRLDAYRLADRSGERVMRDMLAVDQLEAAVEDGDVRAATQYLQRLRDNRLWTKYRSRIARAESRLDMLQGRFRDALAALDRFLVQAQGSDAQGAAQAEAAKVACLRMDALIALGDLSLARAQVPACRDIGSGSVPIWSALGRADIARYDGDLDAARALADQAERLIEIRSRTQRSTDWWVALAETRIRLSQPDAAERILRGAAVGEDRHPGAAMQADIEVGLAEIAAVRGDWNASLAHETAARARMPHADWSTESRLQLLEGAHLQAQGRSDDARRRLDALMTRADRLGDIATARDADALLAAIDRRTEEAADATQRPSHWLADAAPGLASPLTQADAGGATAR